MTGVQTDAGDRVRLDLIAYMRSYNREQGYLPSIADLARHLRMNRTAVIWHLEMLRDQGRIDYVDGAMARSLRLIR